jgi:hypothetical protein
MKLELQDNIERDKIGEFKEIESKIENKNLSIIMNMVSKSLYSNPLGSMIREITSNCFDANKENNVDLPINVYLEKDLEDSEYYAHFIDNGTGISPEMFESVYMNWFSSTKRDSNDLIGGWGLGSKSPLAYQDYFYIITVCDNKEYTYILAKEDSGIPNLSLLTCKDSTKPTGTTIKVKINQDDLYSFHTECKKQLTYFDGVIVKTTYYYDNNYSILEGKTFKVNTLTHTSDPLHVCYGQVKYPLDFKKLNLPIIIIPVGIKVDIGEIDVTINREQIHYTEKSIKCLTERYHQCLEELKDLFLKQNTKVDDLKTYLKQGDKKIYLRLGSSLDLDVKDLKVKQEYSYIDNLKVNDVNSILELMYSVKIVKNTYVDSKANYYSVSQIVKNSSFYYANKIDRKGNIYLENGTIIVPNNLNKHDYKTVSNLLFRHLSYNAKIFTNKSKIVLETINKIRNDIKSIGMTYHIPSEEWYQEYLEKIRLENKELLDYKKTIINVKLIGNYSSRTEMTVEKLSNYAKIFYILKPTDENSEYVEDKEYIDKCQDVFKLSNIKKDTFLFVELNKTNYAKIKKLPNLLDVKSFFKLKILQNHFKRYKLYNDYELIPNKMYLKYSNHYKGLIVNIDKYFDKNGKNYKSINPSLLYFIATHWQIPNKKCFSIEKDINLLKEVSKKFNIFRHITSDIDIKDLRRIIQLYKITKLNPKYYYARNKN